MSFEVCCGFVLIFINLKEKLCCLSHVLCFSYTGTGNLVELPS